MSSCWPTRRTLPEMQQQLSEILGGRKQWRQSGLKSEGVVDPGQKTSDFS